VPPSQALRNTGSTTSLGVPKPEERREKNESSFHQVDLPRERNAVGPRTQQVDLTAKLPTPPPPPMKQPSASTSTQVPSRGTPFESPHPPGEGRGKALSDKPSSVSSSVTPHGLPLPPDDRAAAATEPPAQPQPVAAPRREDNSRFIGSEGVQREAKRAMEAPTSDRKERKGATAPDEYETRTEGSATHPDGAKRRKAEPNPPTSYTHNNAPTESSVEQTHSSNNSSGNDSSAARPSEMGKSQEKVEQSSDPGPPLDRKDVVSQPHRPSGPPSVAGDLLSFSGKSSSFLTAF
jgi:hypothetical protein